VGEDDDRAGVVAGSAGGGGAPGGGDGAGAVAGARASGGEDDGGGELTARDERAAEPSSSAFTRFGKANIAGIEVMVPVLVLLLAGVASLGGGLYVALRRREAFGDAP
jgi:hypothetical protein